MKKPSETDLFYLEKRTIRNLRRKQLKRRRWVHRCRLEQKQGSVTPSRNETKDLSFVKTIVGYKPGKRKSYSIHKLDITLPSKFSIIDNPDEIFNAFKKLSEVFWGDIRNINISHRHVTSHDLGAEVILAKVGKACDNHLSKSRKYIRIGGEYPGNQQMAKLVRAIGIVKELRVKNHEIDKEKEPNEKIVLYKKSSYVNEQISAGSIDQETRTTEGLVDYVNLCLINTGYTLTEDAEQSLALYVGEVIDNVKEHSGHNNWQIVGYLDKMDQLRICEIVIYNFGNTISNTFSKLDPNDFAKQNVNEYIYKHRKKNLFGDNWTTDNLTTLIALQGRISCKNKPGGDTRGNGSVDLINFFQGIVDTSTGEDLDNVKMCILSGKTHIKFDQKYKMKMDDSGRNTIAFNAENDLASPPDSKYITNLRDGYFPGTLIAIQFVLPSSATKEVDKGEHSERH